MSLADVAAEFIHRRYAATIPHSFLIYHKRHVYVD